MDRSAKETFYKDEAEQIMQNLELDSNFVAKVKTCTNIEQVFAALATRGARHIAVLTKSSEPISDLLGFSKKAFAQNKEVALMLVFDRGLYSTDTIH